MLTIPTIDFLFSSPQNLAGGPTAILGNHGFFETEWSGEPRILPNREFPGQAVPTVACNTWKQLTGHAGWAGPRQSCWGGPARPGPPVRAGRAGRTGRARAAGPGRPGWVGWASGCRTGSAGLDRPAGPGRAQPAGSSRAMQTNICPKSNLCHQDIWRT